MHLGEIITAPILLSVGWRWKAFREVPHKKQSNSAKAITLTVALVAWLGLQRKLRQWTPPEWGDGWEQLQNHIRE